MPNVFDKLAAWIAALIAFASDHYQIQFQITRIRTGIPFVDVGTGLNYFDQFFVTSPQFPGSMYPLYLTTMYNFQNDFSSAFAAMCNAMSAETGRPWPAVVQIPAAAPIRPQLAPPDNPIGAPFVEGTVQCFECVPGDTHQVGEYYTAPGGVRYQKFAAMTMFGMSRPWWQLAPTVEVKNLAS